MEQNNLCHAIESLLFVLGDPVPIRDLCRVLDVTELELRRVLANMADQYEREQRGILLFLTQETVQMTTNPLYAEYVQELVAPTKTKSLSQAMLETLSVIAYKQPVTRAQIEQIRGVRCEYAVSQLLKQGLIQEAGRKDAVGRPVMFCTTDKFLRLFGLHSIEELPRFEAIKEQDLEDYDCLEGQELA